MERYRYKVLILLISIPSFISAFNDRFSQSFMFTRPAFFNVAMAQPGWHNYAFDQGCKNHALQFIPYRQHTMKNKKNVTYFFIDGKKDMTVKGDSAIGTTANPNNRDIRAEWIGLPADFDGSFCMKPEQRQQGAILEYKLSLKNLVPWCFFNRMWVGISGVYNDVQNEINFEQSIAQTFNTSPATIKQALDPDSWCYGKFTDKTESSGLGEVRMSFGTRFIDRGDWQFGFSTYLSIPGQGGINSNSIFEAFRGFDGHVGWGSIVNIQMPLSPCNSEAIVAAFFDAESTFLFSTKKHRSIDLCNKPWSRYLLLNKTDGETNVAGINVLSPKVRISPYNIVNLAAGIRFKYRCLDTEMSYGLWTHGDEKIKLKHKWKEEYGIAGTGTTTLPDGTTVGNSASGSAINFQATNDKTFTPIQENDLDFKSAASRATISQFAQGAIGVTSQSSTGAKGFAFIGGFFEYAHKNCMLSNWGYWVKIGASF